MRLSLVSPALILAIILGNQATLQPAVAIAPSSWEIAQSVWRQFDSPQGDFSILMPGEPIATTASTEIASIPVDIQGFVVQRYDNTVQYLVTRIDIPATLDTSEIEPDRFLAAMQARIVQQTNGQLLQSQNLTLNNNYPGQEIKLQMTDDSNQVFITTNRLYWVDRKLYQISVTVPQGLEPNLIGSSTGFLNSFQLR